jgi:hypothetical protein
MLTKKTQLIFINAIADKKAANDLIANIANASAPSVKNAKILAVAMSSQYKAKSKVKSAADELLAAIVTGAALSIGCKRSILSMFGDQKAGNEFINEIQVVDTAPIKL